MPKRCDIAGREVEMCTIGEFGRAIGRTAQSVRKWEENGTIPQTPFRDATGKRLWPKTFVEKARALVREERISQGVPIPESFKAKLAALFREEVTALVPPQG